MILKRLLLAALAGLILVIGIQTFYEPGRDQASLPVENRAEQLVRGEYLARAGNCMACHTVPGGQPYAGGPAINTSFGTFYTPNISADRETGIGSWSADDFWRALHNGKSKDGSFLYPAFPYPSYTKVTRADADAMHAFFMRLPAVRQQSRNHQLRFPYNNRVLLAFWRTLYFTPGDYQAEPARSAQWNRGAYLVQGLGHCAACHTGSSALGWYAGSLSSHADTGLGDWDAKDIASLLKTGVSQRGAVFGPMAEVVGGSLQHLSDADTLAMAVYLKSMPPGAAPPSSTGAYTPRDPAAMLQAGAKLYQQHCAECHMEQGEGQGTAYPPLAGNRSLAASPINAIRIVLIGGFPPSTGGNPRPFGMPPFGHALNDEEVAAVVSYLRTSWGNQGTLVSPVAVARLRGVPAD